MLAFGRLQKGRVPKNFLLPALVFAALLIAMTKTAVQTLPGSPPTGIVVSCNAKTKVVTGRSCSAK